MLEHCFTLHHSSFPKRKLRFLCDEEFLCILDFVFSRMDSDQKSIFVKDFLNSFNENDELYSGDILICKVIGFDN